MGKEDFIRFYNEHKGEVIGGAVGLVFALSILSLGFLRILIIALFVFAGCYAGKRFQENRNYFRELADKILRFFNI